MKKLLYMVMLIAPLYAEDGKIDLPLLILRKFKVSEASAEVCQDAKSEQCKKQIEDIDNFVKDSLYLIDIMQNFNPKASVSSKETWAKQRENIPFLWKTIEARHAKGIPVTSMQKYQEAYLLASDAYATVTGFLMKSKLLDAKNQASFQEFLERQNISKKQIQMEKEVLEQSLKELNKLEKEMESKKETDPSEIIMWAAQNLDEVENTKNSTEKARKDGAAKERQRQADSK